MRFFISLSCFFSILLLPTSSLFAQNVENIANVEFLPDVRVFTIMVAIHMGGYNYGLDQEEPGSLRNRILADVRSQHLSENLQEALNDYFRRNNVEMDQSRQQPKYVAYSLLILGPPDFTYNPTEIHPPPQVNALVGFEPILKEFYRQANIADIWKSWRPVLVKDLEKTREQLRILIRDILAFSHMKPRLQLDRRLVIVPDPVNPPNTVNLIHHGGNYFLFVSPSASVNPYEDIFLQSYLHFLLDPTFDQFAKKFNSSPELEKFIYNQPQYVNYSANRYRLIQKSLLNAVQLAFQRADDKKSTLDTNRIIRRDSPFLPFFQEKMVSFESGSETLTVFVKNILQNTDPGQIVQSFRPPSTEAPSSGTSPEASVSEMSFQAGSFNLQDALTQVGPLIQLGKLEEAESLLNLILATDPGNPQGMFEQGQLRYARQEFASALESYNKVLAEEDTLPWILAWSLVRSGHCLARLEKWNEARIQFEKALEIPGVTRGADEAARRALKQLDERSAQ